MTLPVYWHCDSEPVRPQPGSAQRRLHAVALLLSLAVVACAGFALAVTDPRPWLLLALAAAATGQVVALCGWPLLVRCRTTTAALAVGLGMMAFTHVLIGPSLSLADAFAGLWSGQGFVLDPLRKMLAMSAFVTLATVWVTLPAIVAAVVHVHERLLRERGDD